MDWCHQIRRHREQRGRADHGRHRPARASARCPSGTASASASGAAARAAAAAAADRRRGRHLPARAAARGDYESCFVAGARRRRSLHLSIDGSDPRPDPASRFQPDGVHGPSRDRRPGRVPLADQRWTVRPARELDHLRAARRHVHARRHVRRRAPAAPLAARSRHHGHRADAGRRLRRRAQLGLRRRLLYAPSRGYGRPDDLRALRRCRARARPRRHPRRRLQPPRARRRLPAAVHPALPHRPPPHAVGRRRQPRWAGLGRSCGGSSSTTRCTGCASTTSTACGSTRRTRSSTTSRAHIVAELAAAVRAAAAVAGDRSTPRITATSHAIDRSRAATAAGGSTASGPTTSTTSSAAASPATAHGYYADYDGTVDELARTMRQGWLFTGQHSAHCNAPRGTDPSRVPMHRFVVCLQNHDQIGNRAIGDRLHHAIDAAAWRAASALLLTAPMTPLLFMGQEWAASTRSCTSPISSPSSERSSPKAAGASSRAFRSSPIPGAPRAFPIRRHAATFERSRLDWTSANAGARAVAGALHRRCSRLRHDAPRARRSGSDVDRRGGHRRRHDRHAARTPAASGSWSSSGSKARGTVEHPATTKRQCPPCVLSTRRVPFASDPAADRRPRRRPAGARSTFRRPGAVDTRRTERAGRRHASCRTHEPSRPTAVRAGQHLSPAGPRRVSAGRRPRRRAVSGAARRRRGLHLAVLRRVARQHARLRRLQPQRDQPRVGGAAAHDGVHRGGARATGSGTSSTSCRTTWASAPAPTRGGTTCSRTDRARRPRGSSTSTGRRSRRSCTPSCCCRSSAISTATCSSAASCSSSSGTARSGCGTSSTSCRSTRARRRASTARPSSR